MDTGGRDRLSSYGGESPGTGGTGTGGAGSSGDGKADRCSLPIETSLDEVAVCDFYRSQGTTPAVGTKVLLLDALEGGRLAVACDDQVVGYLPVRYSYVGRDCLPNGFTYSGTVIASSDGAVPTVEVALQPR